MFRIHILVDYFLKGFKDFIVSDAGENYDNEGYTCGLVILSFSRSDKSCAISLSV